MSYKIAASILSADFGILNQEIAEVEPYIDFLHVDVMDGHFVKNLTIGPIVLKDIQASKPIDCHLMISNPLDYAHIYAKYCQSISFHAELFNEAQLKSAVKKVKKCGVRVGLALNPDKDIKIISAVLDEIDYVLIMSVFAGFGGQKFIPSVLKKIEILRKKFSKDIAIDGGINKFNIKQAYTKGANVFIIGSSIFGHKDRKEAVTALRRALQ